MRLDFKTVVDKNFDEHVEHLEDKQELLDLFYDLYNENNVTLNLVDGYDWIEPEEMESILKEVKKELPNIAGKMN